MRKMIVLGAAMTVCCGIARADSSVNVSESDFLAEMPIVLSVSRLPQRLDDTPGAVTVIDREMIRLSGARDVAELMRLAPSRSVFLICAQFACNHALRSSQRIPSTPGAPRFFITRL